MTVKFNKQNLREGNISFEERKVIVNKMIDKLDPKEFNVEHMKSISSLVYSAAEKEELFNKKYNLLEKSDEIEAANQFANNLQKHNIKTNCMIEFQELIFVFLEFYTKKSIEKRIQEAIERVLEKINDEKKLKRQDLENLQKIQQGLSLENVIKITSILQNIKDIDSRLEQLEISWKALSKMQNELKEDAISKLQQDILAIEYNEGKIFQDVPKASRNQYSKRLIDNENRYTNGIKQLSAQYESEKFKLHASSNGGIVAMQRITSNPHYLNMQKISARQKELEKDYQDEKILATKDLGGDFTNLSDSDALKIAEKVLNTKVVKDFNSQNEHLATEKAAIVVQVDLLKEKREELKAKAKEYINDPSIADDFKSVHEALDENELLELGLSADEFSISDLDFASDIDDFNFDFDNDFEGEMDLDVASTMRNQGP